MKISLIKKGIEVEDYTFEVNFPGEVDVMPSIGTELKEDTPIASGSTSNIKETINLIQFFGRLTKSDLDAGLACFEGEVVRKGDIVFSKSAFTFGKRDIRATTDGLVSLSEISRGKILIMDTKKKITLKAGIKGKVTGIFPEGMVHVKTNAYSLEMFRVFGKKAGGLVKILNKDSFINKNKTISTNEVLDHKIVVLDFPLTKDIYKAVLVAGAVCVIAPSSESEFFKEISKLKRITVCLSEGWGRIHMPKILTDYFSQINEKFLEVVPGGSKPYFGRVVSAVLPVKVNDITSKLRVDSKIGDIVQVFEPPYWSREAEIVDIFEDSDLLSVRIKSGETLVVPAASLQKFIL